MSESTAESRPYQLRIIEKVLDCHLNKGMDSILIESPCGSGKTTIMLASLKCLEIIDPTIKIGWVAMRRNLLSQAKLENERFGFNVNMQMISMFAKDFPDGIPNVIAGDEGHHNATDSMGHLLNESKPRLLLSCTATAFRTDAAKLCFNTIIRDAGIFNLIRDGYLSQYHHYTIPDWKVNTVVNHYVREPERWGKSLMYFHTLDQCFEAKDLLRKAKVPCDVVTASSDREQQLDTFRSGGTEVLINCMVLTEGFNCPELKTVFVRPSCKSTTIQSAGRVLRKCPGLDFKQVVQCKHTKWPFQKTALPAQQFLWYTPAAATASQLDNINANAENVTAENTTAEGCWRGLQINPEIQNACNNSLLTLAKTQVELPKFLAKAKSHLPFGGRAGRRRTNRGGVIGNF